MSTTTHLIIALAILATLVGLMTLTWLKLKLHIIFKVVISLFLTGIILVLLPFVINIYGEFKYNSSPISITQRTNGSKAEQEASAKYLEVLLEKEPNPDSFLNSIYKMGSQKEIIFPLNRTDLLLINGVVSKHNPPATLDNSGGCSLPLGNLAEQVAIQSDLIAKEITSSNPKEVNNAKKRTYFLLALSNKYIATNSYLEVLMGQYILKKVVQLLETYPALLKPPYIKRELQISRNFKDSLFTARASDLRYIIAISYNRTNQLKSFLRYTFNRDIFEEIIKIRDAKKSWEEEEKELTDVTKKALLTGQLMTLAFLKTIGITDPYNHPDLPENKILIEKIEKLSKQDK
jgi:hypothetical protein